LTKEKKRGWLSSIVAQRVEKSPFRKKGGEEEKKGGRFNEACRGVEKILRLF